MNFKLAQWFLDLLLSINYFSYLLLNPLGKGQGHSLQKTEFTSLNDALHVLSLIEGGLMILKKKT